VFATTNGVAFRRTVVVAPLAAPTGDALITHVNEANLYVTVSASGVADMGDLVVCHIDDEARITAGGTASYFTVEAISDYTTVSKGPLRTMQWQQMTNAWIQDAADIPADLALGATCYAANNDGSKGSKTLQGVPSPEMIGRLAVATGMPLWVCTNPQMTDAALASFFTRLATVYTAGIVTVEVGNEPWNSAYYKINHFYLGQRYAASGQPGFGAAGIGTSGTYVDVQPALAHASFRAWKQAELVLGRSRVRRVVNVQYVNPSLSMIALDYVDSSGILQTGQKCGQLADSVTVAPYPQLAPDDTFNGLHTGRGVTQPPAYSIGVARRWLVKKKAYENNSSVNGNNAALWVEKAWRNAVDMNVAYIGVWQSQLTAKGYTLVRDEYEGHWSHDDMPSYASSAFENVVTTQPAILPGICVSYNSTTGAFVPATATINGDSYPDAGEALATWFADGDIVERLNFGSAGGALPFRTYKCKIISGSLYAFATGAAYTAGLGSQVTGGTTENQLLINVSRMGAWADFLQALMWSNPSAIDGTTFLDYMHSAYYAAGLRRTATFSLVGNAYKAFQTSGFGGGYQPWAMKPDGHWQATTAALTKIRSLP
jgi:hypothetical protein